MTDMTLWIIEDNTKRFVVRRTVFDIETEKGLWAKVVSDSKHLRLRKS